MVDLPQETNTSAASSTLTETGHFTRITKRITQELEVWQSLRDLTSLADTPLENSEKLTQAARSLVETLSVDHVGIMIFTGGISSGLVIAEYPDFGLRGVTVPISANSYHRMKEGRAPLAINRIEDAARYEIERSILERQGIRSVAFVPMFAEDKFIGMVGLDVYHVYHDFTDEELDTALALTSQLGLGIRNALLVDELRKRTSQLEFITNLSRRITATFDRDLIFKIAREETLKVVKADHVSISLLAGDPNTLRLYTLTDNEADERELASASTGLLRVIRTGNPLVEADLSIGRYIDYQQWIAAGLHSAAFAPLILAGRVVGTFNVAHHDTNYFAALDLDLLQQIANQLAVSLENARQYMDAARRADVESLANRLGNALQDYNDLPSLLLNTTRQLADALQANRARVRLTVVPTGTGMLPPLPDKQDTDSSGQGASPATPAQ
ncbi:MAG: GAF domain-containing protein [Anaerolineae bacterium]|nr:GAF domain-containing protein [Anaerolineae bacterium]